MNVSERQNRTGGAASNWLPMGVTSATVVLDRQGELAVNFGGSSELYPVTRVIPSDKVVSAPASRSWGCTVVLLGRRHGVFRRGPGEQELAHAGARLGGPVLILHPAELRGDAVRLASRLADRDVLVGLCPTDADLAAALQLVQRFPGSASQHRRSREASVTPTVEAPPAA